MTSGDLDREHGRDPGTTLARSGVTSRRWVEAHESSSLMAAGAMADALTRSGLGINDLDALIVSAVAPEQPMPTTAILTLAALDAAGGGCDAFDVNASCVGFLTGLRIAQDGVDAGRWERVGVVSTEIASKGLDHRHTEASALFGDGAGGVVVGRSGDDQHSAILASHSAVWPEAAAACRIDAGGTRFNPMTPPDHPGAYLFSMDGAALLRAVARHLPGFLREVQARAGIALSEIDLVIPHQASAVGLRYLRSFVPGERVIDILGDHGNQVSASIPTALDHAVTSGRLQRGMTVLLLGTGAGLTLAATVVRY